MELKTFTGTCSSGDGHGEIVIVVDFWNNSSDYPNCPFCNRPLKDLKRDGEQITQ